MIETGVDKLVNIINSKKRISTTQAAKELGVGLSVIEEWADFLEEEGVISVEYKFASTYLVERKLSKKEVVTKAKEFTGKKDAFIRKVESSISTIDREQSGLTDMKVQFDKFKKEISAEIGSVEKELKELENYERLKKDIDSQMISQEQEFKQKINEIDRQILREQKKYQELLNDIDTEKIRLEEEKSEAASLDQQENEILTKLDQISEIINKLKDKATLEDDMIKLSEKHIKNLDIMSTNIKDNMLAKRQKIDYLVTESKKQEDKILTLQKDVLSKIIEKRKHMDSQVGQGNQLSKNLQTFFNKKMEIEELFKKIDVETGDLKKEMQDLVKKAIAFTVTSRSDVNKHVTELESTYSKLDNKKTNIRSQIDRLSNVVKGK